jgi:hypothetical protein
MKLLHFTGAIASLVLVAVGVFWLCKLGLLGTGLSICILGLISGPALALGVFVFHLRDRIAALEKGARKAE